MGNIHASIRASNLVNDFKTIKYIIMTGIAGGVPNVNKAEIHVRLGDVVISDNKGVIKFDFIKLNSCEKEDVMYYDSKYIISEKDVEHRAINLPAAAKLVEAAQCMVRDDALWINDILQERPKKDFLIDYDGSEIEHPKDVKRINGNPRAFMGVIAASDTLLKNARVRDALRDKFSARAVEMEGAGIAETAWIHEVGYIVVRGICDYCDPSKGDDWHDYAASVAAAATIGLLRNLSK